MNPLTIWNELLRRNRMLATAGAVFAALFFVLAIVSLLDSTQVLGINRWIKPIKFSVSIAAYLWTMAWLSGHLEGERKRVRVIALVIIVTMVAEIVPIVGQAARGRLSHFNVATPFDGAVFGFMGVMIALNTLLNGAFLALFLKPRPGLAPGYLWGIRIGLLIFIVFSAEGALMASRLAHSVGVADGGPGLPFVNWSTRGGDLRVAHFFGIHALQALPVTGYLFSRSGSHAVALTILTGVLYACAAVALLAMALMGKPLAALN